MSVVLTNNEDLNFEIPEKIGKYRVLKQIGCGSYSMVVLVENFKNSSLYFSKI